MRSAVVLLLVGLVATSAAQAARPIHAGTAIPLNQPGARSQVVYSNLTTQTGYYFNSYPYSQPQDLGDDLHMTSGGVLDGFKITYESDPADPNYAAPQFATVSFYALSGFGPSSTPIAQYVLDSLPGDGAWIVPVTIPTPVDVLPADIVMTVLMDSVKAGPITFYPPTVGTTTDGIWAGAPDNAWYASGDFGLPANTLNFGFEVSLVPEPAGALLLALAGLALRRR